MAKRITRPHASGTAVVTAPATGPLRAVYGSYMAVEAHIVKGLLEDSGLQCFLSNDILAGASPGVVFATGGIQVFVQASDADRAAQILRDQSLPNAESAHSLAPSGRRNSLPS